MPDFGAALKEARQAKAKALPLPGVCTDCRAPMNGVRGARFLCKWCVRWRAIDARAARCV